MREYALFLGLLTLTAACASRPHHVESQAEKVAISLNQSDLDKIDKTIQSLHSEIDELQSLNEKLYGDSLKANSKVEAQIQKKVDEFGSFESMQANLRILESLKEEGQKTGPKISKSSSQNSGKN